MYVFDNVTAILGLIMFITRSCAFIYCVFGIIHTIYDLKPNTHTTYHTLIFFMKNLELMVLYYRYKRGGVMCCHDDITSPAPFRKIPLKQRKALLVSSHLCSRHSTSRACKMHASSMSGGSVELDAWSFAELLCPDHLEIERERVQSNAAKKGRREDRAMSPPQQVHQV